MSFINNIWSFTKKNIVMFIAMLLAIITSLIIPIDKEYINYFDFKTLTCLFCTLTVICALKNINFFYLIAKKIITIFKTTRSCILVLVFITFIGSMLIANDMALLTFLPLGYFILSSTGKEKYMAVTFILQSISANLGGMLTPFGNPQNLYLYSKFNIPTNQFLQIMFRPFCLSILLIFIFCMFIKSEQLKLTDEKITLPTDKTIIYLLLFILSIIMVFRIIPYWIGLILIPIVILILDKKALLMVDYPLLLTFVFFFIFAGNVSRIDIIKETLSEILNKDTLLTSILSCQIISNVPSAVLLSNFTTNYKDLLIGVNIGGTGTLIASLASLITFKEYIKYNKNKSLYYIGLFSVINFGFLIILTLFSKLT